MTKKLIFILFFGLFFLAGCGNKPKFVSLPPIVEPIIEKPKPLEEILPPDSWTYPNPEISINEWTWIMLAEFDSKVDNEISYTATEEDKQNGRKWSMVSWYLYTYTYQDLGIKITTSPLYEPYFSQKTNWLIFKRQDNIIYLSGSSDHRAEYIQMFTKDPSITLQTTIEQNHLWTGCIAYNRSSEGYDFNKDSRFNLHGWKWVDTANFFDITGPWWSLWSDIECRPDNEFPNIYWPIFFVQSLYHNDRYYKISMSDGCAPGPCTIFWTIEFF